MFTPNRNLTLGHLFVFFWGIHMDKKAIKYSICEHKKYQSAEMYSFGKIFFLSILVLLNLNNIHLFFLYRFPFLSILHLSRYLFLVFLQVPLLPCRITILYYLHLPLILMFPNLYPQNQLRHPYLLLHLLLRFLPHLPCPQYPPTRQPLPPPMNPLFDVPLAIFSLLPGTTTMPCLPSLIILPRNQVLVKVQGIPSLLTFLFFVFHPITVLF